MRRWGIGVLAAHEAIERNPRDEDPPPDPDRGNLTVPDPS